MNIVANILALIAELIGLLANSGQLLHTLRTKLTKGVSGWSWALSTGGNIAWVVYGSQKRIIALQVANMFLVCIGIAMMTRLYRIPEIRNKMITYSVLVGLGLSLIFIYLPFYSGWLALVYGTLARTPQLFRAYKDKDLSGLSYNSQLAFSVENVLTGIYALMLHAWPLVVAAIIGVGTTSYMIIMVAKKGKTT